MTTTISRRRLLRRAIAGSSVAAVAPGLAGSSSFARASVSPSVPCSTSGSAPSDVIAPAIRNLNLNVAGNRSLRGHTRVPIAMHYGLPPVMTALKEEVCEVFVIGGGASAVLQAGAVAAMANKPFWLQLVGTGITATFALHFAAVLSHATWPAVNCHQLYVHPLIKPSITVANGTAAIPERPGLGVDLDEDAMAKYRIEPQARQPDPPETLMAVYWPTGGVNYYAFKTQYWDDFRSGRLPIFVKGVRFEAIENNGSREWKELQDRTRKETVFSKHRIL